MAGGCHDRCEVPAFRFCCLVLSLDGRRTRWRRSSLHLRAGGDDGTELRTGARAEPPGNPSAWPIRARSGIPHASWDGQVPIPAQIRIGLLVASVHLSSLPSALVSVSPRSARPAALGYTSADTVPAPRQNDRVHSAPVPAHTWRSARPTVKRRLDRARAPSASAASGQPPVLGSSDRAACTGARPTHAAMRSCAHFS